MKSSTSLKQSDEVFWLGVDSNGNSDLIRGLVEDVQSTHHGEKYFHVEEIGGARSLTTDNPHNLMKIESIMKSHEIEYIR